jgi:hypothetical protein
MTKPGFLYDLWKYTINLYLEAIINTKSCKTDQKGRWLNITHPKFIPEGEVTTERRIEVLSNVS